MLDQHQTRLNLVEVGGQLPYGEIHIGLTSYWVVAT